MGFLKKILVITTLCVVLLAYCLYVPLPEGFIGDRRQAGLFLSVEESVNLMSKFGCFLGLGSRLEIFKSISEALLDKTGPYYPPVDKSVRIENTQFDGVWVRIYTPPEAKKNGPGVVYYHGGGYALFRADHFDSLCTKMAKKSNAVVVSVDYRTAPKSPFPSSSDDGYKATKYFLRHATDFDVNPNRVALLGDSAGGNMAAVLSLRLRDEKFTPMPKLQMLVYPHLQSIDYQTPSYQENNLVISSRKMVEFFTALANGSQDSIDLVLQGLHVTGEVREKYTKYLSHDLIPKKYFTMSYKKPTYSKSHKTLSEKLQDVAINPYKSPLLAKTLQGVPYIFMLTCHFDPLRDDGLLFIERLKREGIKYHHVHDQCFHGMFVFPNSKYVEETMKFVRDNL